MITIELDESDAYIAAESLRDQSAKLLIIAERLSIANGGVKDKTMEVLLESAACYERVANALADTSRSVLANKMGVAVVYG